ncbi:hypothetical protein MASR2M78_09610 [Treponema sp.]
MDQQQTLDTLGRSTRPYVLISTVRGKVDELITSAAYAIMRRPRTIEDGARGETKELPGACGGKGTFGPATLWLLVRLVLHTP